MKEDDKITYLTVAIIMFAIMTAGVFSIYSYFDSQSKEISAQSAGNPGGIVGNQLRAMVKGSIYESGEYMTVFGTCMDSYDIGVNGSYATFSAWYPNGTQYIYSDNMTNVAGGSGILEGYFFWNGAMNVVGGTYLTEMTCYGFNQTAKAFGEWQNPVWVSRIAPILEFVNATQLILTDMNGTIYGINATNNQILSLLQNLTVGNITVDLTAVLDAIANLSLQITQENNFTQSLIISGFNDTQIMITNNFNNLTLSMVDNFTYTNALIYSVNQSVSTQFNSTNTLISNLNNSMVSNFTYTNSLITTGFNNTNNIITQNNSVIISLIYMLLNSTSTPVNGSVTWDDYSVDPVRYMKDWTIKTAVEDEYGRSIQSPYVACTINTTGGAINPTTYMTPEGDHFTFTTLITYLDSLTYNTVCFRV